MITLLAFFFPALLLAQEPVLVDSLVAKVGREAVLLSDLHRFQEVNRVLVCAGVRKDSLPQEQKLLLESYIDEELMYLEARSRKVATTGLIPEAVRSIHKNAECRLAWQGLGQDFSRFFRTDTRAREGESLLVRELEKRVLVERFRKTELGADGELWRREAKSRYPVKVYIE